MLEVIALEDRMIEYEVWARGEKLTRASGLHSEQDIWGRGCGRVARRDICDQGGAGLLDTGLEGPVNCFHRGRTRNSNELEKGW